MKVYGKERLSLIYLLGCSITEGLKVEFNDLIKAQEQYMRL